MSQSLRERDNYVAVLRGMNERDPHIFPFLPGRDAGRVGGSRRKREREREKKRDVRVRARKSSALNVATSRPIIKPL